MQSCSCNELPLNYIKCPPLNYNYDCCRTIPNTVQQFPVYRDKLLPNNNYKYPSLGKEKDEDIIKKTRKEIILQKKYHAYRRIWNCNKFANQCGGIKGQSNYNGDLTTSSKYWPPPIVPVRGGLKIPVEYVPEQPLDLWSCLSATPTLPLHGEFYGPEMTGEDGDGDGDAVQDLDFYHLHRIKAQPQDEIKEDEMTRDKCLKGILNTHESQQFSVQPPVIFFMGSQVEKSDELTKVITVRNKGMTPRRMVVINPQNPCFDIIWGAGLQQNTLIAPGLINKIIVKFTPPKLGKAINGMITIIIDDDGAIVVPIIAENSSKPILQMEDWDLGCCPLNTSKISKFEVINRGGGARFWILSEEEFVNEYMELRGPKLSTSSLQEEAGEDDQVEDEEHEEKKAKFREKMFKKVDHLITRPFKLYPCCFNLQKNQNIHLYIYYFPRKAQFDIKKVALLCDNGEVRWITIRGIGIDPIQNPLVKIDGKWTAPPIDLPTDLNTRLTIDFGDLLAGQKKNECFILKNNSCMTLYFFWSIRPLHLLQGAIPMSEEGSSHMIKFEEGLHSPEWKDYNDELNDFKNPSLLISPVLISPASGILKGHQILECQISIQAPFEQGYHSSVLSIFVQQLDEELEQILTPFVKEFNDNFDNNLPIPYESLIHTLPPKKKLEKMKRKRRKNNGKNFENDEKNDQNYENRGKINFKSSNPTKNSKDLNQDTKTKLKNSKSPRGPCTKSTENSWSLGPMVCPVICLERDKTQKEKNKGTGNNDHPDNEENFQKFPPIIFNSDPKNKIKKLLKYPFPPTPLFYMQKVNEVDLCLEELKSSKLNQDNDQEDHKYKDYFGKICHNFESNEQEEFPLQESQEILQTEIKGEAEKQEEIINENKAQLKLLNELSIKSCILHHQFNYAKKWLDDTSPLEPTQEIEIWSQTIPLQCWFDPPQVTAFGQHSHKIVRTVEFINHTAHPVQLTLDPLIVSQGMIICRPYQVTVESFQSTLINLAFDFGKPGQYTNKIKGSLKFPFTTIECWLPFRIISDGPSVQVMSPIVNFGVVLQGTEHVKTIPIKNNGTLRTKWRAKIPQESLRNDQNDHLALTSPTINKMSLVRSWPTSGILDPGQTSCIQIYLSPPPLGQFKLSCSCQIIFDDYEDPSSIIHITVLADIQSPRVILQKCRLPLSSLYSNVVNLSAKAELKNLASFFTPFKWLQPMGQQAELCTVTINPSNGILPPKSSIECQIEFSTRFSFILHNLFLLCLIGGVKEPLIAKLEGTVLAVCLKIIIPKTKLIRIKQQDLDLDCPPDLWPQICQLETQGEDSNEMGKSGKYFVDYLAIYGKYCLVKHEEIQAPPPSVAGLEEESQVKLEVEEEDTQEEEEAQDTGQGVKEKKKKGKSTSKDKKSKLKDKKTKKSKSKSSSKEKKTKKSKSKPSSKEKKTKKSKSKSSSKEKKIKKSKEKKGKKSKKGAKKKKPQTAEVTEPEVEEDEEEEEEEEEESHVIIPKCENPFTEMMPEDYNPELMSSEGKLIYFQLKNHNQIATVKICIHNEAPVNTPFNLNVVKYPAKIVEPKIQENKQEQQFAKLDDYFFRQFRQAQMEPVYDLQAPPKDLLNGQLGGVFNVWPSQGILKGYQSVEINIEFQANTPGLYEDQLECHFEGLETPYVIKLEALATMCHAKCGKEEETIKLISTSSGESMAGGICERRLNPLLYF